MGGAKKLDKSNKSNNSDSDKNTIHSGEWL